MVIDLPNWGSPKGFGLHPDLSKDLKRLKEEAEETGDYSSAWAKRIDLSELRDERHPEVTVIPRDRSLEVVDGWGDYIGFMRTALWFSSTDFYAELDENDGTVFNELVRAAPFMRLGGISQLGFLVPARPDDWIPGQNVAYLIPTFPHTRWIHSLTVAILMEVTLARNGFSAEERNPMVLTAGCHDIAIPAGGDPVQMMDPEELDEERNFSEIMERFGLGKRWKELFGFDLEVAQQWVMNDGTIGLLLDVLDKISYTALDCYYVGGERPGKIRDFCIAHPLVMDVWQDIRFTEDRTQFAFTSPERLYDFLVLRALEHTEFLFNPESRRLDLYLTRLLRPLYESGEITRDQLLSENNEWLHRELKRRFPDRVKAYVEPDLLGWERFETEEEQERFCSKIGEDRVERREKTKSFRPGLYLPVFDDKGDVVSLGDVLETSKVETLERMAQERVGYYVFYYL